MATATAARKPNWLRYVRGFFWFCTVSKYSSMKKIPSWKAFCFWKMADIWINFPFEMDFPFFRMVGWSQEFAGFSGILRRVRSDHSKSSCARAKVNYVACSSRHQSNQLQRHKSASRPRRGPFWEVSTQSKINLRIKKEGTTASLI